MITNPSPLAPRPQYHRQNEISLDTETNRTNGAILKKRIVKLTKYIFTILIISSLILSSAKWVLPYLSKNQHPPLVQWCAKMRRYSSLIVSKLLSTIKTLKSNITYRRGLMNKVPVSNITNNMFAYRALLRINTLCQKLRNTIAKIFTKDEEKEEEEGQKIVLNLFGIIEVRKTGVTQVHSSTLQLPKMLKPTVMETKYGGRISSSSYETVKDVIKRWNSLMDLMYSV